VSTLVARNGLCIESTTTSLPLLARPTWLAPRLKTLEELYCADRHCEPERFGRTVFWRVLPWHLRIIAPLTGGYRSPLFSADRELISAVGLARSMEDVREDIRDYFMNPVNRRWTRRILHLRISTVRLKNFARPYLPNPAKGESKTPW
jgi:hypothetical protein